MNTNQNNSEIAIEALTLRFKQILERSVSSNNENDGTNSTLSSVERLRTYTALEPTPISSTNNNTGFPAALPLGPNYLDENILETHIQRESIINPVEATKVETISTTEKTTRCPYCDKECETSKMRDHTDSCESRHIDCEACGEKVMLDIFDFHLETCTAALYRQYNGDYLYNAGSNIPEGETQNHQEENWNEGVEPEGEGLFENENEEDEEEHEGPYSVSDLTYEQLIALDNTIVKKGLTEEELKQCPVEVHLKELDAPVSCTVCLSDAESGEFLRKLSCGHKFHRDCVDTWLKNNITCPSCKQYLR